MMHMTFYWGKQATILFEGWSTSTWTSYSLSLVALLLSAVLLQYVANLRITTSSSPGSSVSASSDDAKASLLGKARSSFSSGKSLLRSGVFGLRVGIGYLLMLAVMSFNAGVFIAVVLGFVVGHFLFTKDSTSSVVTAEENPNACGC